MSRLGKQPLQIPDKVKVEYKNNIVEITGPMGKLVQPITKDINVKINENKVVLELININIESNRMQGLIRGLLKNAFIGVISGFKKDLEIQGLGYKAAIEGKNLILQLGFSHPINFSIPDGIKISVDKQTLISIIGIDKSKVGEIASYLHELRPPEPYKGTGVRYVGEHIIRKVGKAAAGSGGGAGGKK